jgi:hypothetical protein
MWSRRFGLLVGILVTLNLVLWFAAPGLALRRAIVQQLFGPKLIRADVLTKNGDWRLDRGVVLSANASQIVLREFDGRVQPIALSSSTKVIAFGHRLPVTALSHGWRVLVTWPASGAAASVDVEHIGKAHGRP